MRVSQRSHVLHLPLDSSLGLGHMDDCLGDVLHCNFLTSDGVGGHCKRIVDPAKRSGRYGGRTFDLAKSPLRDILYDGVLAQL